MEKYATKLVFRGRGAYVYLPVALTQDKAFPMAPKGSNEVEVMVRIRGYSLIISLH